MLISLSSFITTVLFSTILILLVSIFWKVNTTSAFKYIKFFILSIIFLIIRIFLPFEFFFTRNINSMTFIPLLKSILDQNIKLINLSIANILLLLWGGIGLYQLAKKGSIYRNLKKILNRIPTDIELTNYMREIYPDSKKTAKIRVIRIKGLASPVIIGFIKTIIVFPDLPYTDSDIEFILKHELQHYRQKDLWTKAAIEFLCILYWWNPFIRLLRKQLLKVSEINTDLQIVKELDEKERINYLECLLKVASCQTEQKNCFSLAFSNKEDLKQRFDTVLNPNIYMKKNNSKLVNIGLCVLLLLSSYSIVFEPYILPKEVEEEGVGVTSDNSFIICNGDSYDLYVDGEYFASFKESIDSFPDIRIYESLEEATK